MMQADARYVSECYAAGQQKKTVAQYIKEREQRRKEREWDLDIQEREDEKDNE